MQELIKCVFHTKVRERPKTIFHCLHLPQCEMWLAAQIGVFTTDQVECSGQSSENVLLDISVINHSELEKRGLKGLQDSTTNQDNKLINNRF